MNAESREIQLTSHVLFALIPPTKRSFGFQSPKREKGFLEKKNKNKNVQFFFFARKKAFLGGSSALSKHQSPPHPPQKKIIIKKKII
jgi:hypothetical protein